MKIVNFRAWDKEQKRMLQVASLDFTLDFVSGFMVWKPTGPDTETRVYEDLSKCILMESTGLQDRNGKPIYEYDFVRNAEHVYMIHWDQQRAGWMMLSQMMDGYGMSAKGAVVSEVIGNSFENPNLMPEVDGE